MGENIARGITIDGADQAGLDSAQLRSAFEMVGAWVEQDILPGAAALVARGGQIAGEAYFGLAHRAQGRPVDSDTIWSLASITKPFTATAVMLLVEQGVLSLDEPVGRLLPEFLRAPQTPFDRTAVTLRHLLSHCSGLPGFSEDNVALRQAHRPLEDLVRSYARQPLLFAPGSMHYYSNCAILTAAETAGRALSGTLGQEVETPAVHRLQEFIAERILAPLGMASSALLLPPEWDERIAWVERTGQENLDWETDNSAYFRGLGIPWGGLYSRPRDLVRFVDLFLPAAGGCQRIGRPPGAAARARLVSASTAQAMTSVQFAPPDAPAALAPELRDGAPPAHPLSAVEWGLGWEVKGGKRAHRSGELTSPSTYAHAGSAGTMAWADPERDLVCILLTNRALLSGWTTERPRQALFSNAVAAALR